MAARSATSTQVIVHGIDLDAGARPPRAEREPGTGRAGRRSRRGAGRDRGQLPRPQGLPRPAGGRPAGRRRRPTPVRFVIIGQGPLEADLRRPHAQLGLAGTVDIVGYRADAARITAAADLFVLASHHEGLPVAVMEALAARRAGGGHRRRRPGRGGEPTTSRAAWCRPAGPTCWPRPSPSWPATPTTCGPAWARGRRGPPGPFSAGRSELEVEAVYRRALDRRPAAGSGRPAGGHADRGDPGGDVGDHHGARPRPPPTRRSSGPGVTTAPVPRKAPGADGHRRR